VSKVLFSATAVLVISLFLPGYSQVNRRDSALLEIKKKESSDYEEEKRSKLSLIDNAIDNPFTETA
jgi:hypothetical protein